MNALEQALLERLKASEAKSVAFLQALLRAPSPNPPGDTRPAAALVLGALGGVEPAPGRVDLEERVLDEVSLWHPLQKG